MVPSEESMKIGSVFCKYVSSGDRSLIQDIPEDKLELALLQYAADKRFPHYDAMERRLNELKETRKSKLATTDKWKDRIIAFILGIVATLLCGYLKGLLKLN